MVLQAWAEARKHSGDLRALKGRVQQTNKAFKTTPLTLHLFLKAYQDSKLALLETNTRSYSPTVKEADAACRTRKQPQQASEG